MPPASPYEPAPSLPGAPAPRRDSPASRPRAWFLAFLDGLLAEKLRQSSHSELVRYRVLVAAALFQSTVASLYLVTTPVSLASVPSVFVLTGYVGTLVLARRGASPQAPALLLCITLSVGMVSTAFLMKEVSYIGVHAAPLLITLMTVYLLGPRPGFVLTVLLCVSLCLLRPLYHTQLVADPAAPLDGFYWPLHFFTAFSMMGAWVLSTLHGAARDEAQASLERTLRHLRDSEGKLQSLIESTEDRVCSVTLEGHVLIANSATRHRYRERFGRELQVGQRYFPGPPLADPVWGPRLTQVMAGQRLRFEEGEQLYGEPLVLDVSVNPILGAEGHVTGMTIFSRDITARKQAEGRLGELHRTLVDISRQVGMAEVATGVLHNVGNALNSINISTSLLMDKLRALRLGGLARTSELLHQHAAELSSFLTTDVRGQRLPAYLTALSNQLHQERDAMIQELMALQDNVDHVKSIISMQQRHARVGGAIESVSVPQLVDEALRLHARGFEQVGARIERDYSEVPVLLVDRHKLLQILLNLLSNARQALEDSEREDRRLTVRIKPDAGAERLLLQVEDTGVGIAPEHQWRVFTQGFTTKKMGHGFGLHSSALAASEMGGQLSCSSPGLGLGATFTLALPLRPAQPAGPE
ncbi:MAG TPA: ATP-binding protein [Myxococcaceae bacterium]|nr:ATP-binding protein [Myxococcaceae bacterium]